MRKKNKRVDIVKVNRDLPVLWNEDDEVIDVIDVEVVPEDEEKTSSNDYFRRWLVLFLTTVLFWGLVFIAAWFNRLLGG